MGIDGNEPELKTVVDRSIKIIIPPPQQTPSCEANSSAVTVSVSPSLERLHRIQGTSLLAHATFLLRTSPSTFPTACTIFHRFYHRCSLQQYDVWSVCLGCIMLACKVEEDMRPAHDVILIFIQIYRRFRLGTHFQGELGLNPTVANFHSKTTKIANQEDETLTNEEKCNILRYIKPVLKNGPIYLEWREKLETMENIILRELGFTLYWIPSSHPHNFLLYFIRVLEIEEEKAVGQISWSYCNDSCRLDLSVRYEAEVIACASILLASLHRNIHLPLCPRPWWHVFLGSDRENDLSIVCNALLALRDPDESMQQAFRLYVVSLTETSFIDPSSFIWSQYD